MSEMMPESPQDPFVPPEADDLMGGLQILYAAALKAGFPETRAFELVRDLFINQMATVQMLMMNKTEQEG